MSRVCGENAIVRTLLLEKEKLRCAELSGKVDSLEQLQKEQKRRVDELQKSLVRSDTAIELLEAEKIELEEKFTKAAADLCKLEQEIHRLAASQRDVEELKREVALSSQTITMQNEQLDRVMPEREEAVKKSEVLAKKVDQLTISKSELLSEAEQLQKALNAMESELDYLKVSYITCNDKLADASERNANKDGIVAKFRSANLAAKQMVANVEEQSAQTKSELEMSEKERCVLEERLVAMERELQETTDQFASYQQNMEEKLAERQDLIGVIQSTAEALKNTFEHKLASVTQEHETQINEVDQAVSGFTADFVAACMHSQESLTQLGVVIDTGDIDADEIGTLTWSQSLRIASDLIPRWQHIILSCSEAIA